MSKFEKAQKRRRLVKLEAENKALKQQVADLKANIKDKREPEKRSKAERKAKIKQLEHNLLMLNNTIRNNKVIIEVADELINALANGDIAVTMQKAESYKALRGITTAKIEGLEWVS